ncbi:MAG: sodium:calcium antiporter [Parcubacteria group bacterium]|nr:sodium:calcium antiporter [Parcubacteria group bacterium]
MVYCAGSKEAGARNGETRMSLLLIIFLLSFFFLGYSSSFLVRILTTIARFLRLSEYAVAFILMSVVTSAPELFIGIAAAVRGVPILSLGDVLGANIINITLVIGLAALFGGGLSVESKISRKNFFIIFGLALFPIFLAVDGMISRGDGLVLLLLLAFYLWSVAREREHFTKAINHFSKHKAHHGSALRSFMLFGLGAAVLLVSSGLLVWSGSALAKMFSISTFTFGVLFISLGSALPEIGFSIRAAILKHPSMTVGNALGSIAFTAAGVVGIVSIIHPIEVERISMLFSPGLFLLLALLSFNLFLAHKMNISRREGWVLVSLYLVFILSEYVIGLGI